jgi:two-component system phosphate regulon sensor histidine kinase PhoR
MIEGMDNHLDRPEVIEALAKGVGTSKRHSDTLNEETTYLARALQDNTILRVAGSQRSVVGHLVTMIVPDLLIIALAALITALIARFTARRILRPFAHINFARPLESETYPELAPLLTKLNSSFIELSEQSRALKAQQHELEIVTGNMKEGLILVDAEGHVLSLNTSAAHIFNITEDVVAETLSEKRHLLTISRNVELQQLLEAVLAGKYSESELEQEDRYYQVLGSPVISKDEGGAEEGADDEAESSPSGAVLLIRDITEWHEGDVLRKQFSANVSHELKTPLTVINGYAELMKQGMVNPGDEARLASLIHDEATRMILMIDDILTLSQLDESGATGAVIEESFETLDLLLVSEEVCRLLRSFAQERQITLNGPTVVPGTTPHDEADEAPSFKVKGVRTLVTRMIYNLVENAIRYSDLGGSVTINLSMEEDRVAVSVADNGIGIPLNLHDKVFERFFCVDQSRSKATGGTGLGLAIVKNGAKLHKATIDLTSAEGQGTTVVLRF